MKTLQPKHADMMLRAVGIEPAWFARTARTAREAEQLLTDRIRSLDKFYHPDPSKRSDDDYQTWSVIKAELRELGATALWRAAQPIQRPTRHQKEETVDPDLERRIGEGILGGFTYRLKETVAGTYIIIAQPHFALGNTMQLTEHVAQTAPWFGQQLTRHHEYIAENTIPQLEERVTEQTTHKQTVERQMNRLKKDAEQLRVWAGRFADAADSSTLIDALKRWRLVIEQRIRVDGAGAILDKHYEPHRQCATLLSERDEEIRKINADLYRLEELVKTLPSRVAQTTGQRLIFSVSQVDPRSEADEAAAAYTRKKKQEAKKIASDQERENRQEQKPERKYEARMPTLREDLVIEEIRLLAHRKGAISEKYNNPIEELTTASSRTLEELTAALKESTREEHITYRNIVRALARHQQYVYAMQTVEKGTIAISLEDAKNVIHEQLERKTKKIEESYTEREHVLHGTKTRISETQDEIARLALHTSDAQATGDDISYNRTTQLYFAGAPAFIRRVFSGIARQGSTARSLLYIDHALSIHAYNMHGHETTLPAHEAFTDTGRTLIGFIEGTRLQDLFTPKHGTIFIAGEVNQAIGGQVFSVSDLVTCGAHTSVIPNPQNGFSVLSARRTGEHLLYRVEGKLIGTSWQSLNSLDV